MVVAAIFVAAAAAGCMRRFCFPLHLRVGSMTKTNKDCGDGQGMGGWRTHAWRPGIRTILQQSQYVSRNAINVYSGTV